jgi:hypothetical protein
MHSIAEPALFIEFELFFLNFVYKFDEIGRLDDQLYSGFRVIQFDKLPGTMSQRQVISSRSQ